jgi:predicted nucleotidyltransferase
VQFSAEDVGIAEAVAHAQSLVLGEGLRLRVATAEDLIVLKLAAAAEPQRRASKREHDLADVLALLEEHPQLRSPQLASRVREIREQIFDAGLDG